MPQAGRPAASTGAAQSGAKAFKLSVRKAKADYIASQLENVEGGQKSNWEAARAINGGDSRAATVAIQKFLDDDGNLFETPAANADAAAKHFTEVYNISRERATGTDEAIASVEQRPERIDLDEPITRNEVYHALRKAKTGKATSNHLPIELLGACRESEAAMGLLRRLVSDIFESERETPLPPPEPPLKSPSVEQLTPVELVQGARKHGWRCK